MDILILILIIFIISEIVITAISTSDSILSVFPAWFLFVINYFVVSVKVIISDITHQPWKRIWLIPLLILVFPLFYLLLWSGRIWAIRYKRAFTRYENNMTYNNKFARGIGVVTNFIGGHQLMQAFAYSIKNFDNEAFHQLEWCWDNIGDWMP